MRNWYYKLAQTRINLNTHNFVAVEKLRSDYVYYCFKHKKKPLPKNIFDVTNGFSKKSLLFLRELKKGSDGIGLVKKVMDSNIPFEKIPAELISGMLSFNPSETILEILHRETRSVDRELKIDEILDKDQKLSLINSLSNVVSRIPESWWKFIFKSKDYSMLYLLCNGGYGLSNVPLEWTQSLAHKDIRTFLESSKKCRESTFDLMIFDRYYWSIYEKDNSIKGLYEIISMVVPKTVLNKIAIPYGWVKSLNYKSQGNIENNMVIKSIINLKSMDNSSEQLLKQQFLQIMEKIDYHSLLVKCKKIGLNINQVPTSIILEWESELPNIKELYANSSDGSELLMSIVTSIKNQISLS